MEVQIKILALQLTCPSYVTEVGPRAATLHAIYCILAIPDCEIESTVLNAFPQTKHNYNLIVL